MLVRCCFEESVICLLGGGAVRLPGGGSDFWLFIVGG